MNLKDKNKQITAFCAKGGYRSTFFSTVFSSIGIIISQLEDGYKGYRKSVIDSMPILNDKMEYIVIHGHTGVGKTDLLNHIKKMGYNVLDLEKAANHRGSLLGSVCMGNCNSQKLFDSNICYELDKIHCGTVFVEAESKRIGNVIIPPYIFDKMEAGIHIYVNANMEYRIKSLKKDYVLNQNWINESITALEYLRKYISKNKIDFIVDKINSGNFDFAAKELMENYYDPMYNYQSKFYDYAHQYIITTNPEDTALAIINDFDSLLNHNLVV